MNSWKIPASDESGPVIQVRELTKAFGEVLAVDRVFFGRVRGRSLRAAGSERGRENDTYRMLVALLVPASGGASVAGCCQGECDRLLRSKNGVLPEARYREHTGQAKQLKVHPQNLERQLEDSRFWIEIFPRDRKLIESKVSGFRLQ